MAKYKLVSNDDGNVEIPLDGESQTEALFEALDKLGYHIVAEKDDEIEV